MPFRALYKVGQPKKEVGSVGRKLFSKAVHRWGGVWAAEGEGEGGFPPILCVVNQLKYFPSKGRATYQSHIVALALLVAPS